MENVVRLITTHTRTALGAVEPLAHPPREEIELAAVLQALSDPMRLTIVIALAGHLELSCKEIELPVVKSTCTHHFRVLREAGVIRQRQQGTSRLNSLRRADLDVRFPGLLDAVLGGSRD
jgi:DNA-binding transcriptional ArsR family regulator